ncbi:MAG: right-handed parallel beta-helix repeat-containing protein [Armatimonadota bacterium]
MACRHVHVAGCQMSALGDTMHIQCCRDIDFTGNQITGSRMGAFFLAEYCANAVITGNTVDGTNGSRVMSVERSCTNVTITGNTFRNGGRGSWINQPQRLIMANNLFINNTTKGEHDPRRGRKCLETGGYQRWPELYFTTWEPDGRYGPVIVQGNLFVTGPECTDVIAFARGGHDLLVAGNVFDGATRTMRIDDGCESPQCQANIGMLQ